MLDNNTFYGVSFYYNLLNHWYPFTVYFKSESEVEDCIKLFMKSSDIFKDYTIKKLYFDLSFETLKKFTGKK